MNIHFALNNDDIIHQGDQINFRVFLEGKDSTQLFFLKL